MNSINHNSVLSNFFNGQKRDTQNQLNLNQYQQNSQFSRSIGFTIFNNPYKINTNAERVDPVQNRISSEQQNMEVRDATIGFEVVQGFFQSSNKFSFQSFKGAKIKKAATFQYSQGYLNATNAQYDNNRQNPPKCDQRQIQGISDNKNRDNQNEDQRGSTSSHVKKQHQFQIKREQHLCRTQCIKIKTNRKNAKSQLEQISQNSLQHLKSIAKIAYQAIRSQRVTTYQVLSDILLQEMLKQKAFVEKSRCSNDEYLQLVKERQRNQKNQIIQSMIQRKSFSQIKQMKQMEQKDKSISRINKTAFKQQQIECLNQETEQTSLNVKNIRRRLYDAINVMLSANIIQKKNKGGLALRSPQNKNIDFAPNKIGQQFNSFDQLQNLIKLKKQQVDAKRKYRQLLVTKYLTLQKHVSKTHKVIPESSKLNFPLIFANFKTPSTIKIENQNQIVSIESKERIDVKCELDMLLFLYWIQRDEIRRKQDELQSQNLMVMDQDLTIYDNLRKTIKVDELFLQVKKEEFN